MVGLTVEIKPEWAVAGKAALVTMATLTQSVVDNA